MTEKELRDSLLNWDATGSAAPDPRQLTANILARDKRRVRLLTGLTIFFWLLTAVVMLFVLFAHYWFVLPRQVHLLDDLGQKGTILSPDSGSLPPVVFQQVVSANLQITQMVVKVIAISVLALVLATLSTVLLVFATRRATLRHVNASLVEISEQLKQLRAASGK